MQVTINGQDVSDGLISLTITRNNDLGGGRSTLTASFTITSQTIQSPVLKCHPVTIVLSNQNITNVSATSQKYLTSKFTVVAAAEQSDGSTIVEVVQLDGATYNRRPIYSKAQMDSVSDPTDTPARAGTIAADVLSAFNVPYSGGSWGTPQYDLAGSYDSDPISVAAQMAVGSGYVMYVSSSDKINFTQLTTFLTRPAIANVTHILERAGTQPPQLDTVIVTGLTKSADTGSLKKIKSRETVLSVFGTVEEETITEINPDTGDETIEVNCMLYLLRPETGDATFVSKERTEKRTSSDDKGRITGSVTETERNTAAILPESKDAILVPAERVEYSVDFNKETNEVNSVFEKTFQVFVIGKLQSVTFSASGIKHETPTTYARASSATLTEEEEENQYISPLVLARTSKTSYDRIGRNTWREKLVVTERQLISKTNKGGEKNSMKEVQVLGGMKTVQNSSKIVNSVPLAQSVSSRAVEILESPLTAKYTTTIPNACSVGKEQVERIELSLTVSAATFKDAGMLQALPRINPSIAYSLRVTANTLLLVMTPMSLLDDGQYTLLPTDITYTFTAGETVELAGTFLRIGNSRISVDLPTIPPPQIVTATIAGETYQGVFSPPVYTDYAPPTVSDVDGINTPTAAIAPVPSKPPVYGIPDVTVTFTNAFDSQDGGYFTYTPAQPTEVTYTVDTSEGTIVTGNVSNQTTLPPTVWETIDPIVAVISENVVSSNAYEMQAESAKAIAFNIATAAYTTPVN